MLEKNTFDGCVCQEKVFAADAFFGGGCEAKTSRHTKNKTSTCAC